MPCKLTHARHNTWHCTTPGLFRSLQKGSRKKQKLDVQHTIGGVKIHFTGYEPLGGNDLRLLQGLVAWAGLDGVVLSPCPDQSQKISSELRKSLQTTESGSAEDAIFLRVSLTRLLQEIGVAPSGKSIADAHQILKRLASVTVFFTQGSVTASSRLLGFVVDGSTQKLWVALNSHLARSIIGDERNFVRINLDEVRLLKTDAGRIIHQRLCVWINPGVRRKVSVEVLCGYAYHEPAPTANSLRKRLERLHYAVADIQQCGWQVFRETSGDYVFIRPHACRRLFRPVNRTAGGPPGRVMASFVAPKGLWLSKDPTTPPPGMPRDAPSQLGELVLLAPALRAVARSDRALLLARSVTRANTQPIFSKKTCRGGNMQEKPIDENTNK